MCVGGGARTSKLSRIKQRPPATDLRGAKASAESLTPQRSSLVVAKAVAAQSDFFSFVVVAGSVLSLGRMPFGERSGTVEASASSGEMIRYSN